MEAENVKRVFDKCYRLYKSFGYVAIIDHVAKQKRVNNPDYKYVVDEHCTACDNDMPSLYHTCLVCGQSTQKLYFKVISQGWNQDLQREEIEINLGENGKLMLIKTDEGFIVDVYGQHDHVTSMTVWEDDFNADDEEINITLADI